MVFVLVEVVVRVRVRVMVIGEFGRQWPRRTTELAMWRRSVIFGGCLSLLSFVFWFDDDDLLR